MQTKALARSRVICWLAMAMAFSSSAQIVNIGGTPTPGHARPPLFVNFGPFKGPSAGKGHGGGPPPTAVYYSPAQIRHAYGFDQLSADGTGQTIAIVDAFGSPTIQSDLEAFCNQFNLPYTSTTLQVENPQNSTRSNSGWAEESSLDVEWAHAIAPGAKIVLVVAKSSSFSDLLSAVDYAVNTVGANVVSMSWGGSESSGETSYDSHFNHPGVTFVASAGDNSEGVEYPAASPYVVSVGGTSLYLNSAGSYSSETAWSGSGGGISQYEPAPSWQSAWSGLAYRGVPDVSYVADPNTGVEVVYNGKLYVFGGTSVGAPQWAALVALANSTTSTTLNSANAALYSVAGSPDTIDANNFYDITSGNNGTDPDDYAIAGYDLVTGLGSPVAAGVVPALAGRSPAPPSPDFTVAVSPSSQTVTQGSDASYTVTVSALNGYAGTVDLTVSGVTGTFSSSSVDLSSSTTGTATLIIPTSSMAAGTYNLTITGTDTSASLTHSVNATLLVTTSSSAATTMTVSSITYSTAGPNLHTTVAVVDNLDNPVPNASVSITLNLNGSSYASGTGTTGSNGQVTFVVHHAPSGTYTTVVNSVTTSGLTWDGNYPANSFTK